MPPITRVYAYKTGTFSNGPEKTVYDHLMDKEEEYTEETRKSFERMLESLERQKKHAKRLFALGLFFGWVAGSLATYAAFF